MRDINGHFMRRMLKVSQSIVVLIVAATLFLPPSVASISSASCSFLPYACIDLSFHLDETVDEILGRLDLIWNQTSPTSAWDIPSLSLATPNGTSSKDGISPQISNCSIDMNLDVSNSNLGDAGLVQILRHLLDLQHRRDANGTATDSSVRDWHVQLQARMNNITPMGFVGFLETLLHQTTSATSNTSRSVTSRTVTGDKCEDETTNNTGNDIRAQYETGDITEMITTIDVANLSIPNSNPTQDENESKGGVNVGEISLTAEQKSATTASAFVSHRSSITSFEHQESETVDSIDRISESDAIAQSQSHQKPLIYIESIDLGFNNIGDGHQHYHPTKKQKQTTTKLYKLLRQFLQSPILCAHTLRLDRCGVNVGICRAIGKVSVAILCLEL